MSRPALLCIGGAVAISGFAMVFVWRRYRSVRPVLIIGLYGLGVTILALSQMRAVTEHGAAAISEASKTAGSGVELVTADDTAIWVLYSLQQWRVFSQCMLLLICGLAVAAAISSMVEIRRQKEVQASAELLRQEKDRSEALVNAVQGLLWERVPDSGRFLLVSGWLDGFLGYSREDWTRGEGFWAQLVHGEDRDWVFRRWAEAVQAEAPFRLEYRVKTKSGNLAWVTEEGTPCREADGRLIFRGIFTDVTRFKEAAETAEKAHRHMVEASRRAGMAEVATGVLHNVGNVLNSVNVTAQLIAERLEKSRVEGLRHAAAMLNDHRDDLATFLMKDARGQALASYLQDATAFVGREQEALAVEARGLVKSIQHINDVIMLQQAHGRLTALREKVHADSLIEDALRLEESVFERQQIRVERAYAKLPECFVPKGQVLQVLVNLIRNARQALAGCPAKNRVMRLGTELFSTSWIRITVQDNGCGIAPDHLTRIFSHGFTTKAGGHGYGLHHAALLAEDMGGRLRAESGGEGCGATFILELPLHGVPEDGLSHAPVSPMNSEEYSNEFDRLESSRLCEAGAGI
ncbi:MAG: PAS domain-containing sensor histidine kinase [Verrucomicrobiales bacterium]|nr:PAS domain-containing sensor histidine kinase [Verrucomicrobiales bacterium]MCP5558059.1 PAS domain-containing sensor histidine kinase [Verrucomicrobiaceae bacterium]